MRSVTEPSAGAAGPIPERGATGGSRRGRPGAGSQRRGAVGEIDADLDVTELPDSALTKGEGHNGPVEVDVEAVEVEVEVDGQSAGPADASRHRPHRSPARGHAMKVLYGDDEWALVVRAAQMLGLRPSSYVASAALSAAQLAVHPPQQAGPAAAAGPQPRRRIASCCWSSCRRAPPSTGTG
jgi:hypothetical protein